ncbi:type II toxin-antitoxin system RelE/ParE family toxin [Maribacter sp. ACAM166]|uniref:type II toxin-antitoxin system RelE/ParE family toxin n=1 Tax=Maribacter sp. ACAM166 TaxID=2508996 RepID=UPI003977BCDB
MNPELGRSAAEYAPQLKRFNYKAHTIFYEPIEKGIFVVRILSQRQDFERHL